MEGKRIESTSVSDRELRGAVVEREGDLKKEVTANFIMSFPQTSTYL